MLHINSINSGLESFACALLVSPLEFLLSQNFFIFYKLKIREKILFYLLLMLHLNSINFWT